MVPTIGIMIGFYILTRMSDLLGRSGDRMASGMTRALAIITFIVAVLAVISLFFTSSSFPNG